MKTTLPASLLRALERLDYHQLGVLELIALGLTPASPKTERQRLALVTRHPALAEPTFTEKEKAGYDQMIRDGVSQDMAMAALQHHAKIRRQRALKRTKVPRAYAKVS